jgi:L-lactate dehydrogenase (cytochrome)
MRSLLHVERIPLSSVERRLAAAADISDLRRLARRRAPRAVFDYVDGAAERELSAARARAALRRIEFHPRVLRDVSACDSSTTILGRPARYPLVFAPTGFTRMMHQEGEPAVARVAARTGIPYGLSTLGTTSIEDLRAASPTGDLWFQLYLWRDRIASEELIRRAENAGYSTLMLTVDTAVAGGRLRDIRNGLTIPPTLRLKTLAEMSVHPRWWADLLTTPPLSFAAMTSTGGVPADLIDRVFDPSMTWEDLAWLRERWRGRLVVKGIATVEDALACVDQGVDAIALSNHGGRQLDRAVTPIELLPKVVDAVGDRAEIYVDGGITSGTDVLAAVALGARAVLVGRAYLYGLMAGGERGVQRTADILTSELRRGQQLLGAARLDDIQPGQVTVRPVQV